jgi:hypothetical protein
MTVWLPSQRKEVKGTSVEGLMWQMRWEVIEAIPRLSVVRKEHRSHE